MNQFYKTLTMSAVLAACFSSGVALAKLPALSDEAKEKAAEAAAKTAWVGKVDTYLLCKSQDKVAASYYKTAKAAGKETKAAAATPACADPGAFVYTVAAPVAAASAPAKPIEAAGAHSPAAQAAAASAPAKPVEAAGAHSPAATAVSPPSAKQPEAVPTPAKKS